MLSTKRFYICLLILAIASLKALADSTDVSNSHHFLHRLELDVKPGAIIHTSDFLKGANIESRTMNHSFSAHLKYAFSFPQDSYEARTFGDVYQGVGVGYNDFNPQLGNPVSAYIFQGAKIAKLASRLSLNYEWNLGLAMGWNPYDEATNPDNTLIGSKVTAYIGIEFYLNWRLSRNIDLNLGGNLTHFSNGNTQLPNFGLNTGGLKTSLAYYFNRESNDVPRVKPQRDYHHSLTYDLILYGSWRQRGWIDYDNNINILPDKYLVLGFSFSPLYRLNPWLKVGGAIDGVYDGSAYPEVDNYYATADDAMINEHISNSKRMALGVSARAEFTMPYFAINVGIGTRILKGSDYFNGLYEVLALKVNLTPRFLLHIGYGLHDFNRPDHLMLGFGWRFGRL